MIDIASSLDASDFRILRELQRNGRLSNAELAQRVGLSPSTCLRRTRALEDAGVIAGYAAIIDGAMLGARITAYIMVNLDQRVETDARMFFDRVARDDRIVECVAITGSHDIMMRVQLPDIAALADLTMDTLLKLPSVRSLTSNIVVRAIKSPGTSPVHRP